MKLTLNVLPILFGLMTILVTGGCHQEMQNNQPQNNQSAEKTPDVAIYLGKSFSSATGADWVNLKSFGDDFHAGYVKKAKLNIFLPSGRELKYEVYNGKADQEEKVVSYVSFRLEGTTPDLNQTFERLKTEIRNVAPDGLQKCENQIIKIQELNPAASQTRGGNIIGCRFDVEKNVYVEAGVNTILVRREGNLVSEWTIFLTFYLKDAWKNDCCNQDK